MNFNSDWLLQIGDIKGAQAVDYNDRDWQRVTLPYAWNEAEAFKVPISQLSDTTMWYRKHFTPLPEWRGRRLFDSVLKFISTVKALA